MIDKLQLTMLSLILSYFDGTGIKKSVLSKLMKVNKELYEKCQILYWQDLMVLQCAIKLPDPDRFEETRQLVKRIALSWQTSKIANSVDYEKFQYILKSNPSLSIEPEQFFIELHNVYPNINSLDIIFVTEPVRAIEAVGSTFRDIKELGIQCNIQDYTNYQDQLSQSSSASTPTTVSSLLLSPQSISQAVGNAICSLPNFLTSLDICSLLLDHTFVNALFSCQPYLERLSLDVYSDAFNYCEDILPSGYKSLRYLYLHTVEIPTAINMPINDDNNSNEIDNAGDLQEQPQQEYPQDLGIDVKIFPSLCTFICSEVKAGQQIEFRPTWIFSRLFSSNDKHKMLTHLAIPFISDILAIDISMNCPELQVLETESAHGYSTPFELLPLQNHHQLESLNPSNHNNSYSNLVSPLILSNTGFISLVQNLKYLKILDIGSWSTSIPHILDENIIAITIQSDINVSQYQRAINTGHLSHHHHHDPVLLSIPPFNDTPIIPWSCTQLNKLKLGDFVIPLRHRFKILTQLPYLNRFEVSVTKGDTEDPLIREFLGLDLKQVGNDSDHAVCFPKVLELVINILFDHSELDSTDNAQQLLAPPPPPPPHGQQQPPPLPPRSPIIRRSPGTGGAALDQSGLQQPLSRSIKTRNSKYMEFFNRLFMIFNNLKLVIFVGGNPKVDEFMDQFPHIKFI